MIKELIIVMLVLHMAQTAYAVSDYDQYKDIVEHGANSPYLRNLWYLEKNYGTFEQMQIRAENEKKIIGR